MSMVNNMKVNENGTVVILYMVVVRTVMAMVIVNSNGNCNSEWYGDSKQWMAEVNR